MFPRFTSGQTIWSTCNSFSIFYGPSMLNSLTRFLYSSSAAEYASAASSILLYPLTEIPQTVNLLSYLHSSTENCHLAFSLKP